MPIPTDDRDRGTSVIGGLILLLSLAACGGGGGLGEPNPPPTTPDGPVPDGWPSIPRPAHVRDLDGPDQSEILVITRPLGGQDVDFAPAWSDGMLTWRIDIQTQHKLRNFAQPPTDWLGVEEPSLYAQPTMRRSELIFENGAVDLRELKEFAIEDLADTTVHLRKRLLLVENGMIRDTPRHPYTRRCDFPFEQWMLLPHDSWTHLDGCLWGTGGTEVKVTPRLDELDRRRVYFIAAVAAPPLTNPVFLKRERFWARVRIHTSKTVTLEPGTQQDVEYETKSGSKSSEAESIAKTLDGELGVGGQANVNASLGASITNTFTTAREVFDEQTTNVRETITGQPGKIVLYSVWSSVERYTIVNEAGDPYTDPNYTFSDLGTLHVRGDHLYRQGAAFDP